MYGSLQIGIILNGKKKTEKKATKYTLYHIEFKTIAIAIRMKCCRNSLFPIWMLNHQQMMKIWYCFCHDFDCRIHITSLEQTFYAVSFFFLLCATTLIQLNAFDKNETRATPLNSEQFCIFTSILWRFCLQSTADAHVYFLFFSSSLSCRWNDESNICFEFLITVGN